MILPLFKKTNSSYTQMFIYSTYKKKVWKIIQQTTNNGYI